MTSRPVCPIERARHLLGGGADVDEHGGMVRHQPRRRLADQLLVRPGDHLAGFVGEVDDAGRHHGAAVHAHHHLGVAEVVEIAADGLRRDGEMRGQILDRDAALLAQPVDDLDLAAGRHARRGERHQRLRLKAIEMRVPVPR